MLQENDTCQIDRMTHCNIKMFRPKAINFRLFFLLFAYCFFPANAFSQITTFEPVTGTSNELLLDDLGLSSIQQPEGRTFTLELPDGLVCESTDGTPPSLNLYADTSDRTNSFQRSSDYYTGGIGAGAVVSIPLNTKEKRNCDAAYKSYLNSKQLETAQLLYELGVMNDDELQEFANRIKDLLINSSQN